MSRETTARDPYLVKSVVHSSQVLSAFRSSGEALPLREVSARCGLPKSMAFRLLYTLERCGMVEKVGENLYRSHLRPFKHKPYRFGYAAQGTDYQFSKEVSAGLQRAAAAEGIELISVDNRYNPKIAQRNADVLVREKVDLVIEFQTDEHVAPIVAAKYREANIPLIAIEIPHPGATYYGANNYEAGPDRRPSSRALGEAAVAWRGRRDRADRARSCRQPAEDAADRHARRHARDLSRARALARHLSRRRRQARRELRSDAPASARQPRRGASWSARSTTPSALGALRAFQEAGRADSAAIMGQNASPEGRAELRERGTRLIGSVAYFPGEVRRRSDRGRARHPASAAGAARRVRQASTGDAGERQSRVSERRVIVEHRRNGLARLRPRAAARQATVRTPRGDPPSTGITCPVVFALWSPASQQIAFAQSDGRIGRRVIVRCA